MQLLSPFTECAIGITTREDGGIESSATLDAILERSQIRYQHIVLPVHEHGTHIAAVDVQTKVSDLVADGMITRDRHVVLAHRVADCAPIVILDRKRKVLLTLHAGWRGITQGIVPIGILTASARWGCSAEDLWIWIGPCIQKQSYFLKTAPPIINIPYWKNYITVQDDEYHIDMVGAISSQCINFNIPSEHIFSDGRDTVMENDTFFSHRRSLQTGDRADDQRFVVCAWIT